MNNKLWLVIHSIGMGVFSVDFAVSLMSGASDKAVGCALIFIFATLSMIAAWRGMNEPKPPAEKLPDVPEYIEPVNKKKCPPHKWEYEKETGRMFCNYCSNPPKV